MRWKRSAAVSQAKEKLMQAGLNHKMEMERMRYGSLQLRPTLPMYACAWVWHNVPVRFSGSVLQSRNRNLISQTPVQSLSSIAQCRLSRAGVWAGRCILSARHGRQRRYASCASCSADRRALGSASLCCGRYNWHTCSCRTHRRSEWTECNPHHRPKPPGCPARLRSARLPQRA